MSLTIEKTEDTRRARILDGAMKVFLTYGFARTTMDDIARAAEISRPMLYLQFRNKADIFRAAGACLLNSSLSKARAALREEGSLEKRLMNALDRALFQLKDMVDDSPHGEEILDMENKIASDIITEWREGLTSAVEETVAAEAERIGAALDRHGLSARALAEMLFDGLEGRRLRGGCKDGHEGARQLVTLIEIALEASRAENA